MTWEEIIKEEDNEYISPFDKNSNKMNRFLKKLANLNMDAERWYQGSGGLRSPSTAVIQQLESMLEEMKKILKQGE